MPRKVAHPRVAIAVRLSPSGLAEVKRIAADRGVPYTALIRQFIAEGVTRANGKT